MRGSENNGARLREKRRRGYGEGTIVERPTKDGTIRYMAQIRTPGQRLTKTFATKKEAREWIRETLQKAEEGTLPIDRGKITVAVFLDRWLAAKRPSVKPNTIQQYEYACDYVARALGHLKLVDLRADHLQNFYASKQDDGLSPRTVLLIHRVLHRALDDAVRWQLVARNVADAVIAPKVQRHELTVWTAEQAARFLRATAEDRLGPAYAMLLYCGLRLGELLGLRWEDVDLQTGRMQIVRSLTRLKKEKGIIVGEPKSAKGRRHVRVPRPVIAALLRWKVRQKEERVLAGSRWHETGYIFTSTVGTPIEPRNFRKRFATRVKELKLPPIRVHDLRHTCATLLLAEGTHPKKVQELLGHSQVSLTMDVYSHMLPSMQDEIAQTLERVLNG